MPSPEERNSVQARILAYAQEIGWAFIQRVEAQRRRGFDQTGVTPEKRICKASLFFVDLLHQLMTAQIRVHDLDLPELGFAIAKVKQ